MRIAYCCLIAMIASGCCVEPQRRRSQSAISIDEVPRRVRQAFERGYDVSELEAVEVSWYRSICAGDDFRYRFHLPGEQTITLDEKGRLTRWVPYGKVVDEGP